MTPQLIYYKVFTPRHKFVIEKHEYKRLSRWIDKAAKDNTIIIARCILVETGYKRCTYHYEKISI